MGRRTATTVELVPSVPIVEAERLDRGDDAPAPGSWWWVLCSKQDEETESWDSDDDGEATSPDEDVVRDITAPKGKQRRWLGCVTKVGSNFAELDGYRKSARLALDGFHRRCNAAGAPDAYLKAKISEHRGNVRKLMTEIREVCHRLGVPIHQVLGEGAPVDAEDSGTALAVVHGVEDAKKYQRALVKAEEKTLPELFKRVKEQHEVMARWMKVEMIPSESELERIQGVTGVLKAKIHTVELYAGLAEECVQVRKGKPAKDDDKVHLIQRRHYMDEECLARYEAGGMSFRDIGEFDKWIARDDHMFRLFPFPRTVIAFRVRHFDRQIEGASVADFIQLRIENQAGKRTFLYIRNGNQLWRVETSIDFEEELFPNKDDSALLSDAELWVKPGGRVGSDTFIRSRRSIDAMRDHHRNKRRFAAYRLWQWHRAGCPDDDDPRWTYTVASGDLYEHESHAVRGGEWSSSKGSYKPVPPGGTLQFEGMPRHQGVSRDSDPSLEYELLTPEHIYFDDAMAHIRRVTTEHNRIAVIIQGLLDRSTCLHPHPPWRIWTPEGFEQGVKLVYDVSRAVTAGEELDFQAYRAQLNKSIRAGCYTLGQNKVWTDHMVSAYGEEWRRYAPGGYGNHGPATIARVVKVRRNGNCVFEWTRERARPLVGWKPCEDRPGWRTKTHSYPPIPVRWECPADKLTCIDAYTPGDYRMFFDDPRTRAQYVRWAPILLSAENWHHKRRLAQEQEIAEAAKAAKKRRRPKAKTKKRGSRVGKRVGLVGLAVAFEAAAKKAETPASLEDIDLDEDE